MPGKLPETQVLITSLFVTLKQRATTSFLRKSDGLFTTRSLFLASLFVLLYLSCATNGTILEKTNTMNAIELAIIRNNLINPSENHPTRDRISPSFDPTKTDSNIPHHNLINQIKSRRDLCHGLSYQKCIFFRRLARILGKTKADHFQKAVATVSQVVERSVVPPTAFTPAMFASEQKTQSAPKLPVHHHPRSRRKRLASGGRRLVHMHCRTRYVMEIQEDGRVVGSLTKTANTILEIQAVAQNGVVRFYSPSTDSFLAMDDRGRLYGTKIYTEEHCAFVERIQENMWTTYSSQTLPNKRRRRNRYKRGTNRAWYVAIGRSGQPRKASRIRPYQNSAQFLPRPLS